MNFNAFLEKKVSGKVAIGFGLLALLELSLVFTPLFYALLRHNDFFRWMAVVFECVASPLTVFFLGSYALQKMGGLSLRVFRLGFIYTLIYAGISLLALFFVLNSGGDYLVEWVGIITLAGIPFAPITALTGNFFFHLWGFAGGIIAFGFAYLVAGPLLYGFLASLIHLVITKLRQKNK